MRSGRQAWGVIVLHSGDGDPARLDHRSRRSLACSKNFVTARTSPVLSARLKSCKPSVNIFSARERFCRLASAMSRHISGELDAMRVVSRNPLAQSIPCSLECSGPRIRLASWAATTCGRWLDRLTKSSCAFGVSLSSRAPTDFHNCSTLRTAAGFDLRVGVTTHTAPIEQISSRSGHAHLLRARHRVAADKVRTGPGNECFQVAHDAALDAPDVGDNRARLERRQHLLHQIAHLGEGGAQDNQLRAFHRALQVQRVARLTAPSALTFRDAGRTADKAHN